MSHREVSTGSIIGFETRTATRVIYAPGAIDRIGEEVARYAKGSVLLVTDGGVVAAGHAAHAQRVIEIRDRESVKVEEIRAARIRKGERILFKTCNSRMSWGKEEFDEDFIYISKEAAAFLAEAGVMTVGIDYLSVGGFRKDGVETHHYLLRAGIWIIEGLNLARVKPGRYELCCLPLKVLNSDGAPARALLR